MGNSASWRRVGSTCIVEDTRERRVGCFGVAFMDIHKGLVYSGRRIRAQLTKSFIVHILCQ